MILATDQRGDLVWIHFLETLINEWKMTWIWKNNTIFRETTIYFYSWEHRKHVFLFFDSNAFCFKKTLKKHRNSIKIINWVRIEGKIESLKTCKIIAKHLQVSKNHHRTSLKVVKNHLQTSLKFMKIFTKNFMKIFTLESFQALGGGWGVWRAVPRARSLGSSL